jgi:hypothetical protein
MLEWLGLEWWRQVWQPLLAAGLVWLATVWKNTSDSRTSRDQRLDTRYDKELARADAEAEELRKLLEKSEGRRSKSEVEKDAVWFAARRMEGLCHRYRHDAHNAIMVMSARAGVPPVDMLPEVPSLQSLLPKTE